MKRNSLVTMIASLFALAATAAPYKLDTAHTDVGFSIQHLMISNVKGAFKDFSGSFDFDEAKGEVKKISVEIKAASIDTRNGKRDDHLRSADFFDVEKHPVITFKADAVKVKEKKAEKIKGMLTMHGVSKEVTLDLTYSGKNPDPMGTMHMGFELKGKINRKDFGLAWNKALEKGGVVVGEEVMLDISGEVVPQ